MAIERRLFFALDTDGNLKLGGPWALSELKGVGVNGNITIVGSPAEIFVEENTQRKNLLMFNTNSTLTVYVGTDPDVSVTTGMPILPLAYFTDDITNGAWYAVSLDGESIDLRWIEVSYEDDA